MASVNSAETLVLTLEFLSLQYSGTDVFRYTVSLTVAVTIEPVVLCQLASIDRNRLNFSGRKPKARPVSACSPLLFGRAFLCAGWWQKVTLCHLLVGALRPPISPPRWTWTLAGRTRQAEANLSIKEGTKTVHGAIWDSRFERADSRPQEVWSEDYSISGCGDLKFAGWA